MPNLLQDYKQSLTSGKNADFFAGLRPGVTVRVHQKIKEGEKSRIQIFEGMIIARKHGSGPDATITVRKIAHGVGVERIYPLHTPTVEKFEVLKTAKVRRAKLYYLRDKTARETRKKIKFIENTAQKTVVATA